MSNALDRTRVSVLGALCALFSLALVGTASAQGTETYQLDAATEGITAQVQEALTVALPVAGVLIAVAIGWRLFRRMVKA